MKHLDPINFCHITPTKYLETFAPYSRSHLILAHLVEQDEDYAQFYRKEAVGYKIMDNSAFEMFKRGEPMYDSSKIHDMAEMCGADCVVMTDHPGMNWMRTVEEAEIFLARKRGIYDTFFVPQSEHGDMEGLMNSIQWALNNEEIAVIGMSILACPIACGVVEKSHENAKTSKRSEAFRMQRYLSRLTVFEEMERRGMLESNRALKRFHCLGMTEGPNEIKLLRKYHKNIVSWDSSAAVWCGLHSIAFDNSPTGLVDGKYEKEVDFEFKKADNATISISINNMNYINNLCLTMGK